MTTNKRCGYCEDRADSEYKNTHGDPLCYDCWLETYATECDICLEWYDRRLGGKAGNIIALYDTWPRYDKKIGDMSDFPLGVYRLMADAPNGYHPMHKGSLQKLGCTLMDLQEVEGLLLGDPPNFAILCPDCARTIDHCQNVKTQC